MRYFFCMKSAIYIKIYWLIDWLNLSKQNRGFKESKKRFESAAITFIFPIFVIWNTITSKTCSPKLANVCQRYSFSLVTTLNCWKLVQTIPKSVSKGWDWTTLSHSIAMDARRWIDSSKAVWDALRRQLSFLYFWLNKRIMTKKNVSLPPNIAESDHWSPSSGVLEHRHLHWAEDIKCFIQWCLSAGWSMERGGVGGEPGNRDPHGSK